MAYFTGEDPKVVQKRIRSQYANANQGYKNAVEQYNKEAKEAGASGNQIDIADSAGPYQLRSIQDAYMKGQLDKSSRDYLLADAFGKAVRNSGKDLANIAAAYTGGAVNNDREENLWDARNKAMMNQAITAEEAGIKGGDKEIERKIQNADIRSKDLANELADKKLILPRSYEALITNADSIKNPLLKAAVKGTAKQLLDKSVNGSTVKAADLIAGILTEGGVELEKAAKDAGKDVLEYLKDEVGGPIMDLIKDAGPTLNASLNMGGFSVFGGDSDKNGNNDENDESEIKDSKDLIKSTNEASKNYGISQDLFELARSGDPDSKDTIYRYLRENYPEDRQDLLKIESMTPEGIAKYKFDTGANSWIKLFGSARKATRILNLARALGFKV